LLYTIDQRWIQGVRFFIKVGADVHLCLPWEPTPLGLAVEKGDLEIVKLLVQSGANPNNGGVDNFPLHDAVGLGRVDLVKILIKAGIEINTHNYSGETPLMIAAYNGDLILVKTLIESGACTHFINYECGENALEIAIEREHKYVVEYLTAIN
jgi:ankyrin repeat protein